MILKRNWIAYYTLVRKEVVRFVRIWKQTLMPPLVTQTLYFVVFGTFIGSQISNINGIGYMQFIVPGLIMMSIINSSFSNVISSFFGAKFQKNLEEIMVSPTPNWVMISGFITGGMLRGIIVGFIVLLISMFFTAPIITNVFIVLIFAILTSLVFSLGGFLNGIYAKKFDDISIFTTFILTPMIYLGGVFYSIKSLPSVWQTVSKFNPIFYMIDGFRYGFYGFSDVSIWLSFGVLIMFSALLLLINLVLLRKGIGLRT